MKCIGCSVLLFSLLFISIGVCFKSMVWGVVFIHLLIPAGLFMAHKTDCGSLDNVHTGL